MVFSDETLLGRYNKRAAEAGDARVEPRQKKLRPTPDEAGGNPITPGNASSGPVRKGKERAEEEGSGSRGGASVRADPVSASSARDPTRGLRSSTSGRSLHTRPHRGGSSSAVGAPVPARPISSRPPPDAAPSSRGRRVDSSRDHPPGSSRAGSSSSARDHPPSSSRASLPSSSRVPPPSSSRATPPSSSHIDLPSSSRVNPPSPPRGPVSLEGGRYDPRWSLSIFDSAFDDAGIAREVVRGACLPADRAQMKTGPFREIVDQAFCSAVRHLHEVEMLAEASSTFLSDARAQDKKSEVLKKKLSEALAKQGEAEAKARAAESRLEDARRRIREMESEDALRRSALRASEARVTDLTLELNGERHEKDVLRLKLQQSEDRERVAVERAETAVEKFRQSAEYQDELAEEAVDGLIRGFEDFRTQVSRYCPQYDFSGMRPRLSEADYQISSEGEGFEEDFSPEVNLVTPVEVELDAPSGAAEGVTPDVGPVILPEVAADSVAAEAVAPSGIIGGAVVEATAAGPEVTATPVVVAEASVVVESVSPVVDIGE